MQINYSANISEGEFDGTVLYVHATIWNGYAIAASGCTRINALECPEEALRGIVDGQPGWDHPFLAGLKRGTLEQARNELASYIALLPQVDEILGAPLFPVEGVA